MSPSTEQIIYLSLFNATAVLLFYWIALHEARAMLGKMPEYSGYNEDELRKVAQSKAMKGTWIAAIVLSIFSLVIVLA